MAKTTVETSAATVKQREVTNANRTAADAGALRPLGRVLLV